ncbi:MAG: hypothetical protein ACRCTI_00725, partial [Beijerinckiaceae bacterium]
MKTARFAAGALVAASLAACNATAELPRLQSGDRMVSGGSYVGAVAVNGWQAIGPYVTVGAGCRLVGMGRIRVLEEPRYGTVRIVQKAGGPAFAPGHRLEHCNRRKYVGPSLYYKPNL